MVVSKKHFTTLGLLLVFGLFTSPGYSAFGKEEHVQATLFSEASSIAPGKSFWVALRMKIDPEWHSYWINPGDTGLGTTLQWSMPAGFRTGTIQWPFPKRIDVSSLISFAYEGEIYLLQEIFPPQNLDVNKSVTLSVQANWLVCHEICLPGAAELSLTLPVQATGGQPEPSNAAVFARARAALPIPVPKLDVAQKITGKTLILSINTVMPPGKITFFPEIPGQISPSGPQTVTRTSKGFDLEMKVEDTADFSKNPLKGVLVAESGFEAFEGAKALQIDLMTRTEGANWAGLVAAVFSAFVGGMILNLMPCVFPVLSIKILGFVRQSESNPGEVRGQGLLFGAGVLSSFLLLAGLLLFFRAGGEHLGWGFQLQSPLVVAGLAILFFAIGLNLMGVFEVGTSLMGLGAKAGSGGGRMESFFSGVLATLVATPCTAPFMGSALGFALSQPAAGALLIFAGIGIGMATPYVLLSFFPQLGRFLPKPGAWMESFKQWMAFPLFATVIWLLWVLGLQVGVGALVALLVTFLAIAMAAWIYGRWGNPSRTLRTQWIARIAVLVLVLGGLGYAHVNLKAAGTAVEEGGNHTDAYGQIWEPYSPERVQALRAEGRSVYVDFTAAWCATCQVNKKLVFGSEEVRAKIKELNVALVRGDWTRRDPMITQALESFDRAGVPLNVIYGKNSGSQPKVLPEVLTAGIVLDSLKGL